MDIAALKAAARDLKTPNNLNWRAAEDRFRALANPTSILSLIARLEALEAVATEAAEAIKYLHSKLGFETSVGNGAFTRLRMAIGPEPAKAEPTP